MKVMLWFLTGGGEKNIKRREGERRKDRDANESENLSSSSAG